MRQETTYIGGTLCRMYEGENGRIAIVNPYGQVFGYPNGGAFMNGDSDYSEWNHHSTNTANELAIAYVNGGK